MAGQTLGSAPCEVGGSFLRPDKWGNLSGMSICFKPEGGQLRFVQADVEFDVSVCLAADQGRKARTSPVLAPQTPCGLLGARSVSWGRRAPAWSWCRGSCGAAGGEHQTPAKISLKSLQSQR